VTAPPRHPAPPAEAVAVELEIPFHDVDVLEVAWHGHYPKYLELARTALMRARRLDNDDLRALGFCFLVVESHLRHLAPLRYGDRARVTAWFLEVENRLRVAYQVENLVTGRLAAHGWNVLVTTLPTGGLCLETPPPILERLRAPGPGAAAS
jgi:acyl-CoA thioester hydrolase